MSTSYSEHFMGAYASLYASIFAFVEEYAAEGNNDFSVDALCRAYDLPMPAVVPKAAPFAAKLPSSASAHTGETCVYLFKKGDKEGSRCEKKPKAGSVFCSAHARTNDKSGAGTGGKAKAPTKPVGLAVSEPVQFEIESLNVSDTFEIDGEDQPRELYLNKHTSSVVICVQDGGDDYMFVGKATGDDRVYDSAAQLSYDEYKYLEASSIMLDHVKCPEKPLPKPKIMPKAPSEVKLPGAPIKAAAPPRIPTLQPKVPTAKAPAKLPTAPIPKPAPPKVSVPTARIPVPKAPAVPTLGAAPKIPVGVAPKLIPKELPPALEPEPEVEAETEPEAEEQTEAAPETEEVLE